MTYRSWIGAMGVALACASVASAAPQRVALYPALDIEAYRVVRDGLTDVAQWKALPKCNTGALPCRLTLRGAAKTYRAGELADGNCDVSILFLPAADVNGRYRIEDGCRVVLAKGRALRMPPDVFNPKPQATITFGDLGEALGGIDSETALARGYQSQRYRWVRAASKKNQSWEFPTRVIRGAVFTEKFGSTWVEPRVVLDNWIDQVSRGEGYQTFVVHTMYEWHYAPPGVACPDCDIYTNQYPIRDEALVGWWRSTDHGRDHWMDAIAVLGSRTSASQGYSFGCSFGGALPLGTSGDCRTRVKTVSTSPLF
jgi:hypothetical protein